MSDTANGHKIWRSADVEAFRGFEYYRDGICRSFMDLVPEPDKSENWSFSGSVETIPISTGRLNRVVATSHLVVRTRREIARSPDECLYLNTKTRGECRIRQSGREIVLKPGDVGLFDSTKTFELEHRSKPDLAVWSIMLPISALKDRLRGEIPGQPLLLSSEPAFGPLIREATATLGREADRLEEPIRVQLYDLILDLVALALASPRNLPLDLATGRPAVMLMSAKRHIRDHCAVAGLNASDTAYTLGISVRYLHKLFEDTGRTFGQYVLDCRLNAVVSELAAVDRRHLTIASIALRHGFADVAHFHRSFKAKFGCTAGEWRHRSAADRCID